MRASSHHSALALALLVGWSASSAEVSTGAHCATTGSGTDGAPVRGVLVYDSDGACVFGAFVSGDGPPPSEGALTKFDEVMALVRSKAPICPALARRVAAAGVVRRMRSCSGTYQR